MRPPLILPTALMVTLPLTIVSSALVDEPVEDVTVAVASEESATAVTSVTLPPARTAIEPPPSAPRSAGEQLRIDRRRCHRSDLSDIPGRIQAADEGK